MTTAPGSGRPVAIRSAPDRGPAPRAGRAAALPRGDRMRVGLRCWPARASAIGPGPVAAPWRTGGTGCPEACRKHDPAGRQLRLRQSSFERVLRPPASDSGCCGRSEKRQNPGAASCLPTVRPCSVTPKRALILRCRSARRKCHRVGRRIGAFAHHLRGFHRLRRVQPRRGSGQAAVRQPLQRFGPALRPGPSAQPFGIAPVNPIPERWLLHSAASGRGLAVNPLRDARDHRTPSCRLRIRCLRRRSPKPARRHVLACDRRGQRNLLRRWQAITATEPRHARASQETGAVGISRPFRPGHRRRCRRWPER